MLHLRQWWYHPKRKELLTLLFTPNRYLFHVHCKIPPQQAHAKTAAADNDDDDVGTLCTILYITDKLADHSTYVSLLQGCIQKRSLLHGKLIHAHIIERGVSAPAEEFTLMQNTLVNMYVKCGSMANARKVFDKMPQRDVCAWTAMIAAYARHGPAEEALEFFYEMRRKEGVEPNHFTFASVLRACASLASLDSGMEIHEEIVMKGFESDVFVANALVDMYAKCGRVEFARQVFDKIPERNDVSWTSMISGYAQAGHLDKALELFEKMPQRDVCSWTAMIAGCAQSGALDEALELFKEMPERDGVSWNAVIAGFAQNGCGEEALEFFRQMQLAGVKPDFKTFACVLPACVELGALKPGMEIHRKVVGDGLQSNVVVLNALIDLYAKCGSIGKGRKLFDRMAQRDVVSWTTMIGGCVQDWRGEEALNLYRQMHFEGVMPDPGTFATILPACGQLAALEEGKKIHGKVIRSGLQYDLIVGNALIDMYAKCGNLQEALEVFERMNGQDVVSWTAITAGYVQNGLEEEALNFFHQMQLTGAKPNSKTFASIIPACTSLGSLTQGMEVHGNVIRNGYQFDVTVANAMIDMYAKCGRVQKAGKLFERMHQRDVVTWTAMISGYAQNGQEEDALKLFQQMQFEGVKPDSKTFASILPACANLAALLQGMEIHKKIITSGYQIDVIATNCLIDMYAKCGSIQKARQIFDKMHLRDVVSWTAMIAGYAMHGCSKEALKHFEHMKHSGLSPDHVTFVCLLSACAHAGLVDEGYQYLQYMTEDCGLSPTMEHYRCMVDLLGRAGRLEEAQEFINRMPIKNDIAIWVCLLGACRIHDNMELGESVAEHIFELDPYSAGSYVLLSNIYAVAGRWNDIEHIRRMMKNRGIRKTPGCSWIEVNKQVHAFLVGDGTCSIIAESVYEDGDTVLEI